MTNEFKSQIAELERRVAALENLLQQKVSDLTAKDKEIEDGVLRYMGTHGRHHDEIETLVYRAYFKTHPEYCETMDRYHEIVATNTKHPPDAKD